MVLQHLWHTMKGKSFFKLLIGLGLLGMILWFMRSSPPPAISPDKSFKIIAKTIPCQEHRGLLNLTGITQVWQQSTLTAQISGRISQINGHLGQSINQDDLVMTLDPGEREILYQKALLSYDIASRCYHRNKKLKALKFVSDALLETLLKAKKDAEANLATIKTQLRHTTITAPFSGIIESIKVCKGESVNLGKPLVTLVKLDPLYVVSSVSPYQRHHLHLNQSATVMLKNHLSQKATLVFMSSVADKKTGSFEIRFSLPNPHQVIPAGLVAKITLQSLTPKKAHALPWRALTLDDEGRKGIKILNSQNYVCFYPVDILQTDPKNVIVAGLPHKSVVCLLQGHDYVVPGQQLSPKKIVLDAPESHF